MKEFKGAAGICIKENKILMVLQGTPDEEKLWTVPSGGLEEGEQYEQCCIREVYEETGFTVKIVQFLSTKETTIKDFKVTVQYFLVEITGGSLTLHDPDELIHEIAWIDSERLKEIKLSFEEDRELLLTYLTD
ncbi:NUDIX hydrolase [Macrococcus lamae]|uniref:NUDIX domain-containing protein n=1 Tax=Macrococcus lamae TaxID=198484 RepID=A0A4R6BTI9_9STAP|nr:NUDIX domain-containing protein [Macrococcus lamae]TDM07885.1 NUDIX domain-containing protein [Macrococcus lamae]